MKHFLGIDIGGTKCATCLGQPDVPLLVRSQMATSGNPEAALEELLRQAKVMLAQHGPAEAVGIVCGGPLDAERGLILSPPNLPGWDTIEVTEFFANGLGLPAYLQNDANAGALAEWLYGAGQGARNMMFCTMGTGFGCGLVLDGRLFAGTNGNAGEIGHVRLTPEGPVGFGKAGSVEGWCSGGGIAQLAAQRVEAGRAEGRQTALFTCKDLTAKTVAAMADNGDVLAMEIFQEVGQRLGEALSMAVDLFNLERIVIGGIFARREAMLRPTMEAAMVRECLPHALEVCKVLPAALGERIGDVAALAVAKFGGER